MLIPYLICQGFHRFIYQFKHIFPNSILKVILFKTLIIIIFFFFGSFFYSIGAQKRIHSKLHLTRFDFLNKSIIYFLAVNFLFFYFPMQIIINIFGIIIIMGQIFRYLPLELNYLMGKTIGIKFDIDI